MKNQRIKELGRVRDGGSLLLEFDGEKYFVDYGIASKTRGRIYRGVRREGEPVSDELEREIKINYALLSDLL
jgi:hypothetical protein